MVVRVRRQRNYPFNIKIRFNSLQKCRISFYSQLDGQNVRFILYKILYIQQNIKRTVRTPKWQWPNDADSVLASGERIEICVPMLKWIGMCGGSLSLHKMPGQGVCRMVLIYVGEYICISSHAYDVDLMYRNYFALLSVCVFRALYSIDE